MACVPYQGAPATGGKCDYVILPAASPYPANILLRNATYAELDEEVGAKTVLMGAFFPPECRNPLLALTCMGSFTHCRFSTVPSFDVYPPCRSVCEAVLLGCTAFFESQGMTSQLPDCDMTDNSTGTVVPAFPPDGTQCLAMPGNLFVPYSQVDCPYPLRYNRDEEDSFAESDYDGQVMCVMPCPNPMWTDSEWNGGIVAMMIVSGISFLLATCLVVTLCMRPSKRRYPGILYIYISICSMAVAFMVIFFPIISGGPTRMVCTRGDPPVEVTFDNAREHDGAGVPCVLQGMGILYFALAANFWWLALCINVFEMVFLGRSVHVVRQWHLFYHIFAWGAPLLGVIIVLAGTSFGALPAVPYCFVAGNEWWQWTIFYIPVVSCLIIGTILIIASVIRFIRVRFRFKGQEGQKIAQTARLLLLIVMYWLLLLYPVIYRIYTRASEDEIADAVEQQVTCSANTGTACEQEHRLNVGSWFLMLIDLGAHGFVVFVGCLSWEMIYFWWRANKLLYTRPWREAIAEIKELITHDESASSSSSSSSKFRMRSQVSKTTTTTSSTDSDEEI